MLTPAQLAGQIATAAEDLNRQTLADRSATGYQWPADVYATVSKLSEAAHGLQQTLDQAARWLHRQSRRGRVEFDVDGSSLDLPQALAGLVDARNAAAVLAGHLDDVAQHAGHLTAAGDDDGQP